MNVTGWRALALVGVGGALGTSVRTLMPTVVPDGAWPWSILTANLVGAFAIGVLLEGLALASPDGQPHRGWRLFLGSGFLGGLTTYSALAVGDDQLFLGGRPDLAFGYLAATVVAGLAACALGMAAARVGVRMRNTR